MVLERCIPVPAEGLDSSSLLIDPTTGLPYESPLSEESDYNMVPVQHNATRRQGYDGQLTDAGHYAEGYDGELTSPGHYAHTITGAPPDAYHYVQGYDSELTRPDGDYTQGYDSQLTDPDYARLRSRAERSTQRRPAKEPTMPNAVYAVPMEAGSTLHGYDSELTSPGDSYAEGYDSQLTDPDYMLLRSRAERSTQRRPALVSTMPNAVYAIPMELPDALGGIYATPSELRPQPTHVADALPTVPCMTSRTGPAARPWLSQQRTWSTMSHM